ncbi:Ankyrin repeat [Fusarium oxysporum f. sp. vasinfectum]|nr:Ankyrin repeat [Fusarium oxysporum f. sp. vasinfectum]
MLKLQCTHSPPNILPRSLVSHQHYFELLGFNLLGLIQAKATIIDIVERYHRRGIPSNHDSSLQIVDKHSAEWQLLMTAVPMSEAIIRDMYQKPSDVTTAIIEQFDKSDYIGHKARIEPPIDDTCVWFLGVPEYVQWLESQSSSLLWITGDPGCGKTTLATFLIESIDQHLSLYGTDYLTTYFFFDWSTEDQVDGTALLFALIHQLLQADPALVLIANKYLEKSRRELDLDKLFEIFAAIVSAPERKPKRLVCVVDALEDCETTSMKKAISFLASLTSDSNNSDRDVGCFKLAVTSHCNQQFDKVFTNLPAFHQIDLADHAEPIKQDVKKFIRASCVEVLCIMDCDDDMRRDIEEELIKRSDNTFLWVDMVLEQLEINPQTWLQSFVPTLRSTQNELDGLYNSTFKRSEAPEELSRILSILAASQRPLTLDEIDVALAVRPDDSFIRQVEHRCRPDIAQFLHAVCGPFIRIKNNKTVSFMHKTATQFLLRSADVPRSPVGNGMYQYKGCLDVVGVNKCLAEICAVYLTLDGARNNASSSDRRAGINVTDCGDEGFDNEDCPTVEENSGPTCQKSGRGAGLFDYAAKYWGTHYRLGHASSSASTGSCGNNTIVNKAITLCNTSTCTFHDWFQLYWNTISTSSKYPDKLTPLMIASHMGLLDLVRELLADGQSRNKDSNHLQAADSEGWTALHWAVWNGHGVKNDDAIALLLQHHHDSSEDSIYNRPHDNDCHCNGPIEDQQSLPAGSSTCVLDIQDNKGLTPLHWAAADDQAGVVRLLLEASATVDVFDYQSMTALTLAYEHGFIDTLEVLLAYGADVNVPYAEP